MNKRSSSQANVNSRWYVTGIIATLIIVLLIPVYIFKRNSGHYQREVMDQGSPVQFAGRESCKECHKVEYDKWLNSDHDRAMDVASPQTVLGDFDNAVFRYNGFETRFFTKDGHYFVHTMGPDGVAQDFQITHTFGFYPLQQYLVPFPGGRFQCLTIAWDDVKKKWYALPSHTEDASDWLHWTRQGQNWNGMCAECHTTGFEKGYSSTTDTFTTSFFEIDVSCEACHGPASRHVAWARQPQIARQNVANYGLVTETHDLNNSQLIQLCARCHARRSSIGDFNHNSQNMMDYMIPSLLVEGQYYPDGQILDEVYVYGSFTQSKMYQRGVKCSDCHDVHSQKLLHEGNNLCLTCHRKDLYDSKEHHFHKKIHQEKDSEGDDCVKCHMPETPYMGIDDRADHSLRIPRPDLSQEFNIPNACNTKACHGDKSYQWSIDNLEKWYGIKKRPHYGRIIQQGRSQVPGAADELISLAQDPLFPTIVRATSLWLLQFYPEQQSYKALEQALLDSDALLRQTAIATINRLQFDKNARILFPMLYDPVKSVRIQAALGVVSLPHLNLNQEQQKRLETVTSEYLAAMQYSADFPSGRYNLALFYEAVGKQDQAVAEYKKAISLDHKFTPALNNLAMLYNSVGKNGEAEKYFKQALAVRPKFYPLAYSLGLLLVEEGKYSEALTYLKKASDGLPNRARIHYNLAMLQQFLDLPVDAEESLLKAMGLEPKNFDYLYALADHYIKSGQLQKAVHIAEQMNRLYPDYPVTQQILNYLNNNR